jgi:SAM-dependent methyltransferase
MKSMLTEVVPKPRLDVPNGVARLEHPNVSPNNKNHWYDGLFYDVLIAPNQDKAFAHVKNLIATGSTVLDVGCGTGRLALQLADKCNGIDGIDPSSRNIDVAVHRRMRKGTEKVRFHHADALGFLQKSSRQFDYATMSYVLHEIDEHDRSPLLEALLSAARSIIIVDYLVPQPQTRRLFNTAVEFAAGPIHYKNFKSYIAGSGLTGAIERTGLRILHELKDDPPSSHIVMTAERPG